MIWNHPDYPSKFVFCLSLCGSSMYIFSFNRLNRLRVLSNEIDVALENVDVALGKVEE